MRRAVPLSIHGDAIPVVRIGKPGTESLECISVQSLLASGPTLRVKLMVFAMFEKNKATSVPGIAALVNINVATTCAGL